MGKMSIRQSQISRVTTAQAQTKNTVFSTQHLENVHGFLNHPNFCILEIPGKQNHQSVQTTTFLFGTPSPHFPDLSSLSPPFSH